MRIRADVAELLNAGHSNAAIARQLNLPIKTIVDHRTTLHIPPYRRGPRPAGSVEDLFWRRTQPTDDGHLLWDGYVHNGITPSLRYAGRSHSAYRIAFRIGNNREPVGRVTGGCERAGCVHPRCVEDQAMRDQYAAIFPEAS